MDIVPPPWLTIWRMSSAFVTTTPAKSVIGSVRNNAGFNGVEGPTRQTCFAFTQYGKISSIVWLMMLVEVITITLHCGKSCGICCSEYNPSQRFGFCSKTYKSSTIKRYCIMHGSSAKRFTHHATNSSIVGTCPPKGAFAHSAWTAGSVLL